MVSRVAVIALVAIVACPILLGYAMNLSESTETKYISNDDDLNVTNLLNDGYSYSYAAADVVDLNTRFREGGIDSNPEYSLTATKTSIPISQRLYVDRVTGATHTLADYKFYYFVSDYTPSYSNWISVTVTFNDNTTSTVTMVHALRYDSANSGVLNISKFMNSGGNWIPSPLMQLTNVKSVAYSASSTFVGKSLYSDYSTVSFPSTYADLAAGYRLNTYSSASSYLNDGTSVAIPNYTNNFVFTMDLSTITASSYTVYFNTGDIYNPYTFKFVKTTVSSVPHWNVSVSYNSGAYTDLTELYYDSTKSSNTYQITVNMTGIKFDYVGAWPTLIGLANSYWDYSYDFPNAPSVYLNFNFSGAVTPVMRVDSATYRAFVYQVMENETYTPSDFRSNPATTISNVNIYGSSITFGGNTYNVSKGNITLGSHQIPVDGLVFSSVYVDNQYENRIGNTVVSTSGSPSTITFNGKWSANISTASMSEMTYTKTEWTPGEFGWDGLDQNFLMVGLLTSIGVFIALGIYMRRTKAALWPLLIVCGGAAMLFFCML